MNKNKVLLAASLVALAGIVSAPAEAGCTPKNGVYVAVGAGYGATIVKDEITTKAGKISYKEKVTSIKSLSDVKDSTATAEIDPDTAKALAAHKQAYERFVTGALTPWNDALIVDPAAAADGPAAGANPTGLDWTQAGNGTVTNPTAVFAAAAAGVEGADATKTLKNKLGGIIGTIKTALGNEYKIFADDREITTAVAGAGKEIALEVTGGNALKINSAIKIQLPGSKEKIVVLPAREIFLAANAATVNAIAAAVRYNNFVKYVQSLVQKIETIVAKNIPEQKAIVKQTAGSATTGLTADLDKVATKAKEIEIASATTTVKETKGLMNINVAVGGQYSFEGFYAAVEAGALFVPGKVEIKDITTDGAQNHTVGTKDSSVGIHYAENVSATPYKLELSEKYSFHATPMVGFQVGTAVIGIKAPLRWVKYELTFTPKAGQSGPDGLLIPGTTLSGKNGDASRSYVSGTSDVLLLKNDGSEATGSASEQKKEENKFIYEVGPFVRFPISDSAYVGLSYTYQPEREVEFETDAYKTSYVHDLMQLGAKHKVTVSGHKFALEFGFVF